VFEGLRKKLNDRRAKRGSEFDLVAAEGQTSELTDDRRARDLPDPLGDFNEIQRMGPTIGGTGSTGV
jgi:hypothetical protein